jgi:hypothetical protein
MVILNSLFLEDRWNAKRHYFKIKLASKHHAIILEKIVTGDRLRTLDILLWGVPEFWKEFKKFRI